jgi:hypothetical protein
MKRSNKKISPVLMIGILLFLSINVLCASRPLQSKGDYLNEQEVERVQEAQEIELRTQVFLFIANRRLKVLTGELKQQTKKEEEAWGPLPQGSPTELLDSYRKTMSELMDKIDDSHERNPKAEGLKKALKRVADSTDQQLKMLDSLRSKFSDEEAQHVWKGALEVAKTANDGAKEAMKSQ